MNINQRLDMLEEKVDAIMQHLGLHVEQPVPEAEPVQDQSLAVEIQKIENQIKVLKIKFRSTPARSPLRDDILRQIEDLKKQQDDLKGQL